MPVSASQHKASVGAYQNKIHDNLKISNPRNHNINQNSSDIPDDIYRIGRDLYRAANSHQVINRVIHSGTSSQPGIVAPLLLLVSSIRLEDSSLLIAYGPDTSSSGSDIPPSVPTNVASSPFDYSGLSSVLSPVTNAIYETGQFLSRYDPLRFPGAEGAVLPVGPESTNKKMYEVQDTCFNKAFFRALTGKEVPDAFDEKNITTEIIFVPRSDENLRIKRADVRLQDVAYQQYIANNCRIRTKNNQGEVVGDSLLVAGEMVRNPIRAAAEKAYQKGTGGHEMPAGMVYFTEGANVVYDIVLGAATVGVYPIVKYSSVTALKAAGQAVNGDTTCLKREFSPEELANLLFNTDVGMLDRRAFHHLPVNVKPGELKNVKTFVPDGLFVHENAANQINSVKYMTVNHLGTEYRIIEKTPGEYWTFHPDAVKPELVERKVYFDAVNDKIHFNSEMPEGQGMDYNIVEGKKFISLHGENHEITWNWDKKRPEVVLQKTNGETLNVPAYMEPLSKVWHMNVHNNKPVFRPEEEKVINEISVMKNNEHNYFAEKNNNQKYYGTGEIYRAEKAGDASHYTQGKYLEMAGNLVTVREKVTPGHGVHYEIYDIKNPEKKGFSVEWDGGRWLFERATSVHVSHELKKHITPDMYDMTADASKMSAPDSYGLRWDEKGNTFLKIEKNFVKINKLNGNRYSLSIPGKTHSRTILRFEENNFRIETPGERLKNILETGLGGRKKKTAISLLKDLDGFTENSARELLSKYQLPENGFYSDYNFALEVEQTGMIPKWADRFQKGHQVEHAPGEIKDSIIVMKSGSPQNEIKFNLGQKIGGGEYGEVFPDVDDRFFLIKKYSNKAGTVPSEVAENEAKMFNRYYGEGAATIFSDKNGNSYVRMYKVPGKTIDSLPKGSLPADADQRIVDMVEKLNQVEIVHDDLHPGNVLWDEESQVFFPIDIGNSRKKYFDADVDTKNEMNETGDDIWYYLLWQINNKKMPASTP